MRFTCEFPYNESPKTIKRKYNGGLWPVLGQISFIKAAFNWACIPWKLVWFFKRFHKWSHLALTLWQIADDISQILMVRSGPAVKRYSPSLSVAMHETGPWCPRNVWKRGLFENTPLGHVFENNQFSRVRSNAFAKVLVSSIPNKKHGIFLCLWSVLNPPSPFKKPRMHNGRWCQRLCRYFKLHMVWYVRHVKDSRDRPDFRGRKACIKKKL